MRFAVNAIFSTLVVFTIGVSPCFAGFTFLGPTPYLSAADSPFAEYLDGPDFYLEDFEDGELNTLGIFHPAASQRLSQIPTSSPIPLTTMMVRLMTVGPRAIRSVLQ